MKTLLFIPLFFSLFILSSCEDVVDLDIPEGKRTVVVEGWITNKSQIHVVKLYYANGLFANNAFNTITGAAVTLSDDAGNTESLQEVSAGNYRIATLKSVEGRKYTLKIQSSAGNYEAVTEVKRLSMPVDSLTFKFEKKSVIYEKEGYYPRFHGQELEGKGDYMQVRLYKNGTYLNRAGDFNLYDDEFFDGNYVGDTELFVEEPLAKNEVARAEVWSMTEDAYRFWVDIQVQLQNGQLFATPLVNTRTNLKKTSANAPDVVGYFGASLVSSVETNVK